jgi:hypothetical protein
MKVGRVFPRRTKASPIDELAFFDDPGLFPPKVDEVHISVTFTYDLPRAEKLACAWQHIAPIKIGGPATGMPGGEFIPGRYLREGYTITSRGCPNRCWFCSVWKREGDIRELPIRDGWNVLDDNLLACSEEHIREVFGMLARQRQPAEFTGGLEAARLKPWHVLALRTLYPKQLFFAYDGPEDRDQLYTAGEMLLAGGFTRISHSLRSYVLIGYPNDTFDKAEYRLKDAIKAGFMPMAMLYRDEAGKTDYEWRRFQRQWTRPAIIASNVDCSRYVERGEL